MLALPARFAGMLDQWGRRPPFLYRRYRALLAAAETWPDDRRHAWISRRLERVLAQARTLRVTVTLPAQTSRHGRRSASRRCSGARAISSAAACCGCPSEHGRHDRHAAGLAAQPGSVVFEQAAIDHICARAGLAMERARVAVLRADFIKPPADMAPPFWRQAGPGRLLLSSFHLAPATARAYAEALQAFRPDVLMCYPSALAHLLAMLDHAGASIAIGHVLASSESLPAATVAAARRQLGATVIDFYGQAERVAASYGINGGRTACCRCTALWNAAARRAMAVNSSQRHCGTAPCRSCATGPATQLPVIRVPCLKVRWRLTPRSGLPGAAANRLRCPMAG